QSPNLDLAGFDYLFYIIPFIIWIYRMYKKNFSGTPKTVNKPYVPDIFELFPANTVEGFVFNPQLTFTQNAYDGRFYTLKPSLRFGVPGQGIQAKIDATYYYWRRYKAILEIGGGQFVEQINHMSSLTPFNNTNYTFLQNLNYLKIYKRTYLEISHSHAPLKNVILAGKLTWNQRTPLQNLPRYTGEDSEFTSNVPINKELDNTEFEKHQAFLWEAKLTWQLEHRYVRKRGQLKSDSPYPALTLIFSGALRNVLSSDLSYQSIALQLSQEFKEGKFGRGSFFLEAGDFISKDRLEFVDFKHFNGNLVLFRRFQAGDFQLLDYYEQSTTNFYLQVHYTHQYKAFNIRQQKVHPLLSLNYLYTQTNQSYLELGLGIYFASSNFTLEFYRNWRAIGNERFGLRFGYKFND
ncbi:MAG: DUF5686 family protein, partial [Bacteroidota bacterium]